MSHVARATAQGAKPWPVDPELIEMFSLLGSQTAVARACGKSRTALRDYLRLRPELRAQALGAAPTDDQLAAFREARRLRAAGLREAQVWIGILAGDPCSYCGSPVEVTDHIHPVARGGAHDWGNMTGACLACNGSKGPRTLLVFLLERTDGPQQRPIQ